MYQRTMNPQSIGGVLDDGFRLYRATFSRVIGYSATSSAIAILPGLALPIMMYLSADGMEMVNQMSLLGWIYGGFFITSIINLAIYTAMTLKVDAIHRSDTDQTGFVGAGFRWVPKLFVTYLLYFLCVAAGLIALVIPGIYLMFALIFAGMGVLLAGRGMADGLGYSMDLVKNNWWRTAAIYTVIFVIYYVFLLLVGVAAGMFWATNTSFDSMTGFTLLEVLMNLIQMALNAIFMPVWVCVSLVLFRDLQLRKEGDDLEQRIQDLEQTSAT